MDGCNRSSIHPGLRVAIVLKADQQSGRRTVGEVANILSPGSYHPRGIKVRLKDGRVGRVQEILPELPKVTPEQPRELVVLLVQRPDTRFYSRKLYIDSENEIAALGLDTLVRKKSGLTEALKMLSEKVKNSIDSPELLFRENVEIGDQKICLVVYICKGVDIKDDNRSEWDWSGWLSMEELEDLSQKGFLSPESGLIVDRIISGDSGNDEY
jgi:uncharacterized repeat protein (TIGR03833 family)